MYIMYIYICARPKIPSYTFCHPRPEDPCRSRLVTLASNFCDSATCPFLAGDKRFCKDEFRMLHWIPRIVNMLVSKLESAVSL